MKNKKEIIKKWLFWTIYPKIHRFPDGDIDDSQLNDDDFNDLINQLENEE